MHLRQTFEIHKRTDFDLTHTCGGLCGDPTFFDVEVDKKIKALDAVARANFADHDHFDFPLSMM